MPGPAAGQEVAAQSAMSVQLLLVLTAAVLLAHALLLQNARVLLHAADPLTTRAFSTRVVQIQAAPAETQQPAPTSTPAPPTPIARNLPAEPPPAPAPSMAVAPRAVASMPVVAAPQPEAAGDAQGIPAQQANKAADAAATAASAAAEQLRLAQTVPPAPPVAALPAATPPPPPAQPLPKDTALAARNYTVPGSVRLKFNAMGVRRKMNYTALGELLWLQDGRSYTARLEAGDWVIGSRVGLSTGLVTADGLAPDRYSDKAKTELAAHFQRDKGKISFSANSPDAALEPGAQDRLSVFVQLASLIAGERTRYPIGSSIAFQTASARGAETWTFMVEAEEKLSLPGGEQASLKLTRAPRKEFDQKIELWLAPALGYLPARIRLTDTSGDFLDLQWRSSGAP